MKINLLDYRKIVQKKNNFKKFKLIISKFKLKIFNYAKLKYPYKIVLENKLSKNTLKSMKLRLQYLFNITL